MAADQSQKTDATLSAEEVGALTLGELHGLFTTETERGHLKNRAIVSAEIAGRRSDNAGWHRVASQAHLDIGDLAAAIRFAEATHSIDPNHVGHRTFLAALLTRSGDHSGALTLLLPLASGEHATSAVFLQIANAVNNLARPDLAVSMILRAIKINPTDLGAGMALAAHYARAGDWLSAIEAIRDAEKRCGRTEQTRRAISGYYTQVEDYKAALKAIDDALQISPGKPEYLLHRFGVLRRLNRLEDALAVLLEMLAIDPANLWARRQAVSVFVEFGTIEKALQHGAYLIEHEPNNEEYLNCMKHLLEVRAGQKLAGEVGDLPSVKQSAAPRGFRKAPSFAQQCAAMLHVVSALVMREILVRNGRNRLGFFWALLEPLVHVSVLAVIFQFTIRTPPPLGDSFFYFYFTGIAPYLLLTRVTQQVGHSVMGNRSVLEVPVITPIDLAISKMVVEVFTSLVVVLVFGLIFQSLGLNGFPVLPGKVLAAFLMAAMFGFGLGMIYAALVEFGRLADTANVVLMRVFYLTGGIFFLPELLPPMFREIVTWNPFMHLVALTREGYFGFYSSSALSVSYMFFVTTVALALGMSLLWAVSPIMRVQK